MKAKKPYKKKRKRLGCGPSSGHGKTSCRGQKGQKSRSGFSQKPGFEGGQMPLIRRVPKRGFNNAVFKKKFRIVNLEDLNKLKETEIKAELLVQKGLIRKSKNALKVLGNGDIAKSVTVYAQIFSKQAKDKIEKQGGKAVVVAA